MINYLFVNFRLHHFKSLGYRKLANFHKSMQIRKPFVPKIKNCFHYKFLGKKISPRIVFIQFSIFVTIWPSLVKNLVPSSPPPPVEPLCQLLLKKNMYSGGVHGVPFRTHLGGEGCAFKNTKHTLWSCILSTP